MAEQQRKTLEAASSVNRIAADISSSLSRFPNLGASSIIITPELYRQLQEPRAQQALIARLERDHPGYRFSIQNFLRADQMGDIGLPSVQIGVERFIKTSPAEIVSDITPELRRHPNLASTSLTITPELYRQLQDPQAQEALLQRLREENPGYRFSITQFIPTFQHGDLGAPGIVIGIERFVRRSTDEICSDITPELRSDPNLASTSLTITPELYRQLQDPRAQAALMERLSRENPGYRFSVTRLIPTEQHGDLGLPGVQISIERVAPRDSETEERLRRMYSREM
jgi:hypothetical protein